VSQISGCFPPGGAPRADDPNDVILALRPDDGDDTRLDAPDREKSLLVIGMVVVEDLEMVVSVEERASVLEGETVLLLVRAVLRLVPLETHRWRLRQWRTVVHRLARGPK
jgi:hypothetical protein